MSAPLASVADSRYDRVVVNLVGDPVHGCLAQSAFVERPYLPGGEHNMYEFAFAAAALGHDVELRGWLHRPSFDRLAAGTRAQPRVNLEARRPQDGDLVVVPEGWRDPLEYGRLFLSAANLALFILAAPGLFGWPFVGGWEYPDPLTVPLDAVARPEYFTAPAGLGFRLLTHSPALAETARQAGAECAFVGTGRPGFSLRPDRERTVDVAVVMDNRWAPLAQQLVASLDPTITVDRIERVENDELIARLSRARLLAWPSRIEGHATIPWEARTVGCVPVALDSNRFAVGLNPDAGAVLVSTVEEMTSAVGALLADEPRRRQLAERGRASAPPEVDWDAYLKRIDAFLTAPSTSVLPRSARAGIGDALDRWLRANAADNQSRLQAAANEIAAAKGDLTQATDKQSELLAEIGRQQQDRERLHGELADTQRELVDLKDRRAVRTALGVAKLLGR